MVDLQDNQGLHSPGRDQRSLPGRAIGWKVSRDKPEGHDSSARKPIRWDMNKRYGEQSAKESAKRTLSLQSSPEPVDAEHDTCPAEDHYYTLVLARDDKLRQKIVLALAANGHLTVSRGRASEAIELLRRQTPQLLVIALDRTLVASADFFREWRTESETSRAILGILPADDLELASQVPGQLLDDVLFEDQLLDGPLFTRRLEKLMSAPALPDNFENPDQATVQVGPLRLVPEKYEVTLEGKPVQLTLTQFRLLLILARMPGWVYSSEQISHQLNQFSSGTDHTSIKTHIYLLRKRLGQSGQLIETVRGMGYRIGSPSS